METTINKNTTINNRESLPMLLNVKEVAAVLKTNVDYVHRLRKAGLLPFLKIGQYKVRKQALERFLSEYEGHDLTDPFSVKELKYNVEHTYS